KATKDLLEAIKVTDKKEREEAIEAVKDAVINTYDEDDEETLEHVKITLDNMVKTGVRYLITDEKIRPDGRKIDEIRDINYRIDILSREHGSVFLSRGHTLDVRVLLF